MPLDTLPRDINADFIPYRKADTSGFSPPKIPQLEGENYGKPYTKPEIILGMALHDQVESGAFGVPVTHNSLLESILNRLLVAHPLKERNIDTLRSKFEQGAQELVGKILQSLDPERNHYFLNETRFQVNPNVKKFLEDNSQNEMLNVMSLTLSETSLLPTARRLITENKVRLGDEELSLSDVHLLLSNSLSQQNDVNSGYRSLNPKPHLSEADITRQQHLLGVVNRLVDKFSPELQPAVKELLPNYFRYLYYFATYSHYQASSSKGGEGSESRLRSVTARSDLAVISVVPGSPADNYFSTSNNYDWLNHANLFNPDHLFDPYNRERLTNFIDLMKSGQLDINLFEIKCGTTAWAVDPEDDKKFNRTVLVTELEEIYKRYRHDVSHSWSSILNFIQLAGRVVDDQSLVDLGLITTANRLNRNYPDHRQAANSLRNWYDFFQSHCHTHLARFYYPIVDKRPDSKANKTSGIDFDAVVRLRPHTDVTQLPQWNIRQEISRFGSRLKRTS